jgi:hypothetical protein
VNIPQSNICKHVNSMMGRTHGKKIEPTPEEAVLRYKHTGKDEDGPSMDIFQANFSKKCSQNSLWNICLAEIFVNDYTQKGQPFCQLKELSNYFFTYLRTLKGTHWRMTTATLGGGTAHEEYSRQSRICNARKQ